MARELAAEPRLVFACGRYEGIDERVLVDAERSFRVVPVSLGDYVLGGGEVAVLTIVEAVARLLPGVIGNAESLVEESHEDGLLEYPVYTKPATWRGLDVPGGADLRPPRRRSPAGAATSGCGGRPAGARTCSPRSTRPRSTTATGPSLELSSRRTGCAPVRTRRPELDFRDRPPLWQTRPLRHRPRPCHGGGVSPADRMTPTNPPTVGDPWHRRESDTSMHTLDGLDQASLRDDIPAFRPGDTLKVNVKVIEGTRSRVQLFQGVVIRRQGAGVRETFTVRKVSFGVGVERTFPVHSPVIDSIEVVTRGDVRRAKLYYLRDLRGKAAKIKEKRETPASS